MSTTSKIFLVGACSISFGIIGYVHYKQKDDRDKLHEGVIKDVERQKQRKIENMYTLQKQIDFTKQLKKDMDVLDK